MNPDIGGLRIIKIQVMGSNSRWQRVEPRRYAYYNHIVCADDFLPVDPTDREVTVAIFPPNYFFPHDPTNGEVRREIERRNLAHPDRAVTETALDELGARFEKEPIVGVCGVVKTGPHGSQRVGFVYESARGRSLGIRDFSDRWLRRYQFLAVVRES